MAKQLKMKHSVHLSAKFGGVEHGEKVRDLKKDSAVSIKNDELADVLVERGLATLLAIEAEEPKLDVRLPLAERYKDLSKKELNGILKSANEVLGKEPGRADAAEVVAVVTELLKAK